MTAGSKQVDELKVSDLQAHPVWEYSDSEDEDETSVRPVKRVPVGSLGGKIVGTQVSLANGKSVWAVIGNVEEKDPTLTQHFLTLSIHHDGRWFDLARYHDFDVQTRGPDALASFLGMSVQDVFPIRYDIRKFAHGKTEALTGFIRSQPLERLSREELIRMAVP